MQFIEGMGPVTGSEGASVSANIDEANCGNNE